MKQQDKKIILSAIILIAIIIVATFLLRTSPKPKINNLPPKPTTQKQPQKSGDPTTDLEKPSVKSLPENISSAELVFIGKFEGYSKEHTGLNTYPQFVDLKIIKGEFSDNKITAIDSGGADALHFNEGSRYLLFSKDDNEDEIYNLLFISTAEHNEIGDDNSGNEIVGCIMDEVECITEKIPCPDEGENIIQPIIRDSEGNIITQPEPPASSSTRDCYSARYSLLKDIITQIQK